MIAAPRGHITAAALIFLSLAALPAQETFTDPDYGYSIKTVKGWDQIPPTPTEKDTIAKWAAPRSERRFPSRMLIHCFDRPAPRSEETPAGGYERDTTPWGEGAWYRRWCRYRRRDYELGEGTKFKVQAPEGVEVTAARHEVTYDSGYTIGGRPMGNYYAVIAVITTPQREWAIEMSCGEAVKNKYRSSFFRIVRSFRILEAKARETRTEPAAAPVLSAREVAREKARSDARRTEGWWFEESENYFLVTDLPRKKRGLILDLKRRLEVIRKVYERDFPPAREITAVSIVRVCKDQQTYHNYGGPGGSAGYWHAPAKELVVYAEGEKNQTRATLMHEAFHQYIYYACGEISPHTWYNEGHGDYYAGAAIAGSRFQGIKPFRWRVDTIKSHIRAGTHVPLAEIIKYSQGEYYSKATLCYAEGWSIVYFLRTGVPSDHAWARILPTYLEVMQKEYDTLVTENPGALVLRSMGRIREKALEAAFEGVDLDALEKAWAAFTTKGVRVR